MRSGVEAMDDGQARVVLEVAFDELPAELEQALGQVAAELVGFEGWLPARDGDRAGGGGLPPAVQAGLLRLVSAAAGEHGLDPVGRVRVQLDSGTRRSLRVSAVINVRPTVLLPQLPGLTVTLDSDEDTEQALAERIEKHLADLSAQLAEVDLADGPAAAGDLLELTVTAETAAGPVTGRVGHRLGGGRPPSAIGAVLLDPHALDVALTGRSVGDRVTAAGRRPGGREAIAAVTLVAVRRPRPAECNDALAARVGFATLEHLRADLRARLVGLRRAERRSAARGRVLAALTAATELTAPAGLVADEVDQRRTWMLAELHRAGTSLDEYLQTTDTTQAQLDVQLGQAATQRVRGRLILDALADAEDLRATADEVGQMIVHRAQRAGLDPHIYARQLAHASAENDLYADVRRGKALALALQQVTLTTSDGAPISLDQLHDPHPQIHRYPAPVVSSA